MHPPIHTPRHTQTIEQESSIAHMDHVITGFITTVDSGIDHAKDSVLRKVHFFLGIYIHIYGL